MFYDEKLQCSGYPLLGLATISLLCSMDGIGSGLDHRMHLCHEIQVFSFELLERLYPIWGHLCSIHWWNLSLSLGWVVLHHHYVGHQRPLLSLGTPDKVEDTKHKLRAMYGVGLSPHIWPRFVDRFMVWHIESLLWNMSDLWLRFQTLWRFMEPLMETWVQSIPSPRLELSDHCLSWFNGCPLDWSRLTRKQVWFFVNLQFIDTLQSFESSRQAKTRCQNWAVHPLPTWWARRVCVQDQSRGSGQVPNLCWQARRHWKEDYSRRLASWRCLLQIRRPLGHWRARMALL